MKALGYALAATLAIALASPAAAQSAKWLVQISEDPLTDQKTAVALVVGDGISFGVKCWAKQPDQTLLIITTGRPHASDEPMTIQARTDKNEVRELVVKGREMEGRQGYVSVAQFEEDIIPLMTEIALAKKRLVVAIESRQATLPIAGAGAAMKKLGDACS